MRTKVIDYAAISEVDTDSSGFAVRKAGWFAIGCLVGSALFAVQAAAQSPREYAIPGEKLSCLVDNQQKYLDLPRAIIMFSPGSCPAIGNEEVAGLAMNSADPGGAVKRLMMTKPDFSCLVDKIDAYLKADGEQSPEETDQVAFVLDCQ